jgi:predicted Fe-S protein YdhL (DUF1289 family)
LAEAINIMHNLAVQEVEANVGKMSDEEKKEALEELSSRVKAKQKQKTQEETAE